MKPVAIRRVPVPKSHPMTAYIIACLKRNPLKLDESLFTKSVQPPVPRPQGYVIDGPGNRISIGESCDRSNKYTAGRQVMSNVTKQPTQPRLGIVFQNLTAGDEVEHDRHSSV